MAAVPSDHTPEQLPSSSPSFVHLHVHSEYSLQDGTIRIGPLVKKAAALGHSHVALTDHGNMHGAVEFYLAAKKSGITPILGCELYSQGGALTLAYAEEFEQHLPEVGFFNLVALARNTAGYHQLLKIVSQGFLAPHFKQLPTTSAEALALGRDLVLISSCMKSEVSYLVQQLRLSQGGPGKPLDFSPRSPRESKILAALNAHSALMQERVGAGNFYIELCDNQLPGQAQVVEDLIAIARYFSLPLVASCNAHYLNAEDADIHALALAIKNGLTQNDINRRLQETSFHLASSEEMAQRFSALPAEALSNTLKIAETCSGVAIKMDAYFLPKIKFSTWNSSAEALESLSRQGLEERFAAMDPAKINPEKRDEYCSRLEYEIKVIVQMGFPDYFLIVQDFINWAKQQGIPVGPGRGSGAGSLVAYALRITDIDPLPYNLIFERFLNPERISMPDFDIDFCQWRRDEVIAYCIDKYGWQSVAQITTFGKMQAKGAVKSVGRAMNISYTRMDQFTKLFPTDLGITLAQIMAQEPRINEAMAHDDELKQCMNNALKLEGLISHSSVHAAGLVISDGDMTEYIPTYTQDGKGLITQYEMKPTEKVGLVKFDFLGLKTLTVIDKAVRLINRNRQPEDGQQLFAIDKIPLDDERVYTLISQGHTCGIFQCESFGITKLIKKLKPNCFEDIIALVALYRPGPLGSGMVESFVERKHGRQSIVYSHPLAEPILRETYGMILYQEQVQKIAAVMASYSLGEADLLRRAMGKKIPEEMAKQRDRFVKGAVTNGIDEQVAVEIFDLMAEFANYGFNKSHSAAYGLLSYQTAYLKTHYPEEFFAACMTCDMDATDKLVRYFEDCQRLGIRVLPPDIATGGLEFAVPCKGEITFALSAIKGMGTGVVKQIIAARENAAFRDLSDMARRINLSVLGKKTLQLLAGAGALDGFGFSRQELERIIPELIDFSTHHHHAEAMGQRDLFAFESDEEDEGSAAPTRGSWEREYAETALLGSPATLDDLFAEKKLLGMFVSAHPLACLEADFKQFASTSLRQLEEQFAAPVNKQLGRGNRERVMFIALLSSITYRRSKKGSLMASLVFEQGEGVRFEVLLFEDALKRVQLPPLDTAVLVVGSKDASFDGESYRFTLEQITSLEAERRERLKGLVISIDGSAALAAPAERVVEELRTLLAADAGEIPSRVKLRFDEAVVVLDTSHYRVQASHRLLHQVKGLLQGRGTVEYVLH